MGPVSATKILLTMKLEIATDVNTFLLGEFINWFLYSISKSWKLTLCPTIEIKGRDPTMVYVPTMTRYLKKMIKLVTKESRHENSDYCELFLTLINEMLESFASEKGNPVRPFNPTILQCDEHISKYKRKEAVFGNTFFEKRTASCEYHFGKSVNKHQRLVSD